MKIATQIQIYKIDHEETVSLDYPVITVLDDGAQYSNMVVLEIAGKKYEVDGHDLEKAIKNALNK